MAGPGTPPAHILIIDDDERLRVSYVGRQVLDLASARRFVIRAIHQLLEAVVQTPKQ